MNGGEKLNRPRHLQSEPVGAARGARTSTLQEDSMKISDIMTRNVQVADPQQSIREAAATMARIDSGALLVGEGDRLVGMITDRDIAIRAVAGGLSGDTRWAAS